MNQKLTIAASALWFAAALTPGVRAADDKAASAAPKPALTVNVTQPQPASLPVRVSANGNIAAWQEASVGTEANGLRLAEVRVNVGDVVKRGQVLGQIEIWQGDRLLGTRRLVASRSVAKPGVAGRAGYYARRTVHDITGLFT